MLAGLLDRFPAHAHALTLAADPDRLLDAEAVGAALAERGFRVVREADPVALRVRIEQARPWSEDRPLIIAGNEIATLPYDCWVAATNRVELHLGDFFPRLAIAELRRLTPDQLQRLAGFDSPPAQLTTASTRIFLLERVFGAVRSALAQPAALIAWLSRIHANRDELPATLRDELLGWLAPLPAYQGWNLSDLITSSGRFDRFLRDQWGWYLSAATGRAVREFTSPYLIDFSTNLTLQDRLPQLLRDGALAPEPVDDPLALPAWARAGAVAATEQAKRELARGLVEALAGALTEEARIGSFLAWTKIAQISARIDQQAGVIVDDSALASRRVELSAYAERRFASWLPAHYRSLAGLALPEPHHLFHVPGFLALQRRQRANGRVALIVLDGMSMADWVVIGERWHAIHPGWRMTEQVLLAQIPTITSISRQALFSGLRPVDFADSLDTTEREPARWRTFWNREGLSPERAHYLRLSAVEPPELSSTGSSAVALVETSIDDLVHAASMGDAQFRVDRAIWLSNCSPRVEAVIDELLFHGFGVWLASDHGHVDARGNGQPNDGRLADIRAKRARLYTDRALAASAAAKSPGSTLWGDDGLLPTNCWTVVPPPGKAFAQLGSTVVTHGGTTLAEVIVPFVAINMDGS